MKLEFIKNVLSVDVDSQRCVNRYVIKAMYDKIDEDNFATIVFKLIAEFELNWKEIKEKGGVSEINKQLKESYGV